jgi:predicted nucleic acid-binding protein
MDRDSLLLFDFMYQRFRDAKKRRALNRRRRQMYLLLHQMNQNMRHLQMLLWPYSSSWIAERIKESQERYLGHYGYDGALSLCCVRFGVESIQIFLEYER